MDPQEARNALGVKWSPDFDAFAGGRIDADQLRCLLCGLAPCACPPFGSDEYMALVRRLNGRS